MQRAAFLLTVLTYCFPTLPACGGKNNSDTPDGSTGQNSETQSFFLPFKNGNDFRVSRLPHVAIDSRGGIHVVYAANAPEESGLRPAYYAYCPSDCTNTNRFQIVSLSDNLGDAEIALDPMDRPRILIRSQPAIGFQEYQYWSCNGRCTEAANWQKTLAAQGKPGPFPSAAENTASFALDPEGKPRFVYFVDPTDSGVTGTLLAACDSDCDRSENWRTTVLNADQEWKNFTLAIDKRALPRILFRTVELSGNGIDYLYLVKYIECATADCSGAGSPLALVLTADSGSLSDSVFSLRLTSSGKPRIAIYPGTQEGAVSPNMLANQMHYLFCDTNCMDRTPQGAAANWSGLPLDLARGQGEGGIDLALDAQDRPRIAYRNASPDTLELSVISCNENCEAGSSNWSGPRTIPSTQHASAELGLYPQQGCPDCNPPIPPCPVSFWDAGYWPNMIIDPAGNAVIVFELQQTIGGGACSVETAARLTRLALVK